MGEQFGGKDVDRRPWKYKKESLEAIRDKVDEVNYLADVEVTQSLATNPSGNQKDDKIDEVIPGWMRDKKQYATILKVYSEFNKGRTTSAIADDIGCSADSVTQALRRALGARKILFEALVGMETIHILDQRTQLHSYGWDTLEAIRDMHTPSMVRSKALLIELMLDNVREMGVLRTVSDDRLPADTELVSSGGINLYIDARSAPLGYDTPLSMMEGEWREVEPDLSPNTRNRKELAPPSIDEVEQVEQALADTQTQPIDETVPDFSDLEFDAGFADDGAQAEIIIEDADVEAREANADYWEES